MPKLTFIFCLIVSVLVFAEEPQFIKVFDGCEFPEGPAWDGQNSLYFSNCYGSWIGQLGTGAVDTLVKSPVIGKTNGLLFYKEHLFALDYEYGRVLKISNSGATEILLTGYKNQKFNRPNDLTVNNNGIIYFTDPKSYGKDKPDGRIFSYSLASRELLLADSGLCFPNGIAYNVDFTKLYVAESAQERVLVYEISNSGELENRKVFAKMPGGDPDGIEIDTSGNVWVAQFGGGLLWIFAPTGELLKQIKTPGKKPTNLEFVNSQKTELILTEVETNSVYKLNLSPDFLHNLQTRQ